MHDMIVTCILLPCFNLRSIYALLKRTQHCYRIADLHTDAVYCKQTDS